MRVFISSTYSDLQAHRDAVAEAVLRLGLDVLRMETFGARPIEPTTACLREVDQCDLFVGVYAHRYGFVPTGEKYSITEMEFRQARASGKPLFCFVIDEDFPWPPKLVEGEPGRSSLNQLKAEVDASLVRDAFTSPEDLAFKVAASLGHHLAPHRLDADVPNVYEPVLAVSRTLEALVEHALREFEQITGTDYNNIFLCATDGYSRQLITVADAANPCKRTYRLASLEGLVGNAFTTGEALVANDVREQVNYLQTLIETRSELVVPLRVEGATIGVLNSESEDIGHFDRFHLASSQALGAALVSLLPRHGWHPGLSPDDLPYVHVAPRQSGLTRASS